MSHLLADIDPCIRDSINELKSNSMKTRIMRELVLLLDDEFLQILNLTYDNKGHPIVTVADCNTDNIAVYEFHLPNTYPFSAPKVVVNSMLYNDFLRIHSPTFLTLLKKITKMNCLCCNSFLCGENWTPVAKLGKIIVEIRMFRKCKRDIVNKFYADKIKSKYLIEDVNLDEWLF